MSKLIFVFALAMLALPVLAQQGNFAEPAGAELSKFPIKKNSLTLAEQAELGLSAKKLEKPVVVQNHFRNFRNGRFVLETLPTGTLVLVSKDGEIRYKADCGNRLVELVKCPTCLPAGSGRNETLGGSGNKKGFGINGPSTRSLFWDSASKAWDGMWETMGSITGFLLAVLIPLLILLAFLGPIGFLLYKLAGRLAQGWQEQTPPPQPQQIPVVAPVAPPAPPQPAPVPAPIQPNPAPQPPATPAFPAGRVIIDLGKGRNATRIQAGTDFARVEFEEDRNNGPTSIRIFQR